MAANYPTIVRKFQEHVDGTEYVLAGHMNDAQDEITAIESTLGTKPATYNPTSGTPTAYSSVGSRLDTIQRKGDAQQTQINGLLDAAKTGWSLPILSVIATGTTVAPTSDWLNVHPSDWHPLHWDLQDVDSEGTFTPGYNINIPKNGWYVMTCTVGMLDPSDSVTIAHYLWGRVRVTTSVNSTQIINMDLAQGDSSASGQAGGYHRVTMAIAAGFFTGDTIQVQLRHVYRPTNTGQPNPTQHSLSATSRTQLTYIRGLPPATLRSETALPYEIGT